MKLVIVAAAASLALLGGAQADARGAKAGVSPPVPGRSAAWESGPTRRWTSGRPGRGHEPRRRHRRHGFALFGWSGGYGADRAEVLAGGGFFTEGAQTRSTNGSVVYDYDRGYPYEHYRRPRERSEPQEAQPAQGWRCSSEQAVRVCRR